MNNRTRASILQTYDVEVSKMIDNRKNISEMDVFHLFASSEIHRMLEDVNLRMWYFSSLVIFDMWENEIETGDPRNSLYLRGDEIE